MQSEYQNKTVFCGFCGASAIYSTDDEKVVTDWNIEGVADPCSVECHIPEDALLERDKMVKSRLHPHFKKMFAVHPIISGKLYAPADFKKGVF